MPERIRVCVVDSRTGGRAYPDLGRCQDLEVVGQLPWLEPLLLAPELLAGCDVIMVGARLDDVAVGAFRDAVARLARAYPVVVVAPSDVDAGYAAWCGLDGFVGRDLPPEAMTRVVRAACGGSPSALTRRWQLLLARAGDTVQPELRAN